jgi:hypothetical protein
VNLQVVEENVGLLSLHACTQGSEEIYKVRCLD